MCKKGLSCFASTGSARESTQGRLILLFFPFLVSLYVVKSIHSRPTSPIPYAICTQSYYYTTSCTILLYLYTILTRLRAYIKVALVNSAKVAHGWTILPQTRARAIYWWIFFPHLQYLWDQISLYEPTWIMHAMPKISWISGSTEQVFSFAFNWKSFQGACSRGNIYKSYYVSQSAL